MHVDLYLCLQLEIDGDFFYFLADAAAIAVNMVSFSSSVSILNFHKLVIFEFKILQFQYGNPDKLCSPLVEAKKAGDDLVVCSFFLAIEYRSDSFSGEFFKTSMVLILAIY